MRKLFWLMILACLAAVPATKAVAAPSSNPEVQLLKKRQKEERKALKMRERYAKQSLRGQNLSPAMRDQMKHQLQKEKRALREKQKNERQELKDRLRLMKESQRLYGQ
jgi:Spy/CpxP family protein refolding chaperone